MNKHLQDILIKDSASAYLYVNLKKAQGEYTDIDIDRYNEAADLIMKSYNIDELVLKNLLEQCGMKLNEILNISKREGKFTTTGFLELNKVRLLIDIYADSRNQVLMKLIKIEDDRKNIFEILQNLPFCACVKNLEGRYMYLNDIHKDVFFKNCSNVLGLTDEELRGYEKSVETMIQDKQVIKEDRLIVYDETMETSSGEFKYYQKMKWPYKDNDNNIIGIVIINIEITDNDIIKKKAGEDNEIFKDIATNIDGIFMIVTKERAMYISPSFEKTFGFDPKELYTDLKAFNLYTKSIEYEKGLEGYDLEGTVDDLLKVITNDNEELWLKTRFAPIYDKDKNIIKRVGVINDITESKKIDEQLQALRMDFFANISHELRTPINLILSCINVLNLKVDKLECENRDYFEKYINMMNQNGLILLKLINNLIDTTRLNSGSFSYSPVNHDIVSFVEDLCFSVSEYVKEKQMNIIFDTDVEEKIIAFDLNGVERIILNLLSNAVKFNKVNGEIMVKIDCKNDIKITISDEGIGIPEDKIQTIFKRFKQVDPTTQTKQKGSGIGLSLVKNLVDMHGGKIEVKSSLGYGSEFIITLKDKIIDENSNVDIKSFANMNTIKMEFSDISM